MTKKFCVYLTIYKGNKLPPFYLGSSSVDRINSGYRGSVNSKQYKTLFRLETKEHPELFKTIIISYHNTRNESLYKESILQKQLKMVKNPLYINKSTATLNGHFGACMDGKQNPNYKEDFTQPKYIFLSPLNEIIIRNGYKEICKIYKLNSQTFYCCLSGKQTQNKGWRIFPHTDELENKFRNNLSEIESTCRTIIILDIKNKHCFLWYRGLIQFCKYKKFKSNSASECLNGKYFQTNGYRFFKYTKNLHDDIKQNIENYLPKQPLHECYNLQGNLFQESNIVNFQKYIPNKPNFPNLGRMLSGNLRYSQGLFNKNYYETSIIQLRAMILLILFLINYI